MCCNIQAHLHAKMCVCVCVHAHPHYIIEYLFCALK